VKIGVFLLGTVLSFSSLANELPHRAMVLNASLLSKLQARQDALIFPSFLLFEKNPTNFTDPFGSFIAAKPSKITSLYDSYRTFDVSQFYNLSYPRVAAIINFEERKNGLIYSIGIDSGYRTSKLSTNTSLFLGVAKTFEFNKNNYFIMSFGSWMGFNVKESPCVDDYSREYWCQNLMAWSDYRPNSYEKPMYLDLKYIKFF